MRGSTNLHTFSCELPNAGNPNPDKSTDNSGVKNHSTKFYPTLRMDVMSLCVFVCVLGRVVSLVGKYMHDYKKRAIKTLAHM